VSSLWTRLGGRVRDGGANVLIQFAREVVGRRRALAGALNEVRHPSVLDALADADFRTLDKTIAERATSDREFAITLARLSHAAAHAKGFDRQMVDAALRLDSLLPADDPSREREKLLREAYSAAQRASYIRGGRVALGRLGQRAFDLGDFERARLLLQQQLDLGPEANDGITEVDSAISLADILRREGDSVGAQSLYRRAGQSAQRLEYYHGLAEALVRQIELMPATSVETRIALQRQAQAAAERTGDVALESEIIVGVARGLVESGKYEEAAEELYDGLALARETGDLSRESRCVAALVEVERHLGRLTAVAEHERDMLRLEERLGNRAVAANYGVDLGATELSLGRLEAAEEAFERGRALAVAIGDEDIEQRALGGLGAVATALRRPTDAMDYLMRALDMAQESGQERHEAQWLGSIAQALLTFGEQSDAARAAQQAVDLARSLNDVELEASLLPLLGQIFAGRRETTRARDSLNRALELNRSLGRPAEQIAALTSLAGLAGETGQPAQATAYYEQALALANSSGDRPAAIRLYRRLARLAQRRNDQHTALELLGRALSAAEALGEPRLRCQVLQHLATTQDVAGASTAAIETYRHAIEAAEFVQDRYGETVMRLNLGVLLAGQGSDDGDREAGRHLQRAAVLAADLGKKGEELRERIMATLAQIDVAPPGRYDGRSFESTRATASIPSWNRSRYDDAEAEDWIEHDPHQEYDDVGEDEVFDETTLPPH
jgi:tetratricopeptide (TPR) repeat protein